MYDFTKCSLKFQKANHQASFSSLITKYFEDLVAAAYGGILCVEPYWNVVQFVKIQTQKFGKTGTHSRAKKK